MIITLLVTIVTGILSAALLPFPTVTELPFGIDAAVALFTHTIHAFFTIWEPLEFLWQLFIAALTIKFLLFSWHWIKYLIGLIRG